MGPTGLTRRADLVAGGTGSGVTDGT